jgi:hypothetical protein
VRATLAERVQRRSCNSRNLLRILFEVGEESSVWGPLAATSHSCALRGTERREAGAGVPPVGPTGQRAKSVPEVYPVILCGGAQASVSRAGARRAKGGGAGSAKVKWAGAGDKSGDGPGCEFSPG